MDVILAFIYIFMFLFGFLLFFKIFKDSNIEKFFKPNKTNTIIVFIISMSLMLGCILAITITKFIDVLIQIL